MEGIAEFNKEEELDDIENPALEIAKLRERNQVLEQELAMMRTAHAEMTEQRAELERAAVFDKLTNLYSRGFCEVEMQRFFASRRRSIESQRQNTEQIVEEAGLIFFDIDKFKSVNDMLGHDAGDEVLKAVSQVIRDSLREDDLAIRWGGEELLGIMFGASAADTERKANEIREKVAALDFPNYPRLRVTISAGVTTSEEFSDFHGMRAAADEALYQSKETGRNKVTVYSGDKE